MDDDGVRLEGKGGPGEEGEVEGGGSPTAYFFVGGWGNETGKSRATLHRVERQGTRLLSIDGASQWMDRCDDGPQPSLAGIEGLPRRYRGSEGAGENWQL